jgi:hypothetical protein
MITKMISQPFRQVVPNHKCIGCRRREHFWLRTTECIGASPPHPGKEHLLKLLPVGQCYRHFVPGRALRA